MSIKWAQCLGLASLVLLENYVDFLGGAPGVRMHAPFAIAGLAAAHLLDIAVLSVLFFAILAPLSRAPFYPAVRLLLVLLVPLYFLTRVHAIVPVDVPWWVQGLLPLSFTLALLLLFALRRAWYESLMTSLSRLSAAFALFALASTVQLAALMMWKPAPHERIASWSSSGEPRTHPLLVWMVFDELSYDQLFEHRAAGLRLPGFDALRADSRLYTDATPIGQHTVTILPSLVAGRVVEGYRYRWSNELDLRFQGVPGWQPAGGQDSVFRDAQRAGWRTAAVGWYNPYCSTYGSSIEDCFWADHDMFEGPMAADDSFTRRAAMPLYAFAERFLAPARAPVTVCDFDVRERLKTYLDLEQHALRLLRTDQADFVLLHLPVPHSPAIWDRTTGAHRTACGGSYLDNLALADGELGKIMALLKASSRWPQTTVIVEGDHAWRVPLWKGLHAWTSEDAAASRDTFDTRPAVLVHRAGQTSAETEPEAWSLLKIHDVIEQTLQQPSP